MSGQVAVAVAFLTRDLSLIWNTAMSINDNLTQFSVRRAYNIIIFMKWLQQLNKTITSFFSYTFKFVIKTFLIESNF